MLKLTNKLSNHTFGTFLIIYFLKIISRKYIIIKIYTHIQGS